MWAGPIFHTQRVALSRSASFGTKVPHSWHALGALGAAAMASGSSGCWALQGTASKVAAPEGLLGRYKAVFDPTPPVPSRCVRAGCLQGVASSWPGLPNVKGARRIEKVWM